MNLVFASFSAAKKHTIPRNLPSLINPLVPGVH